MGGYVSVSSYFALNVFQIKHIGDLMQNEKTDFFLDKRLCKVAGNIYINFPMFFLKIQILPFQQPFFQFENFWASTVREIQTKNALFSVFWVFLQYLA